MASVLNDPKLETMLAGLHRASKAQDEAITRYYRSERTGPWLGMEPRDHAFMADKLVALDREKAEFCYMICRAIGARRIVEVGRLSASRPSVWRPLSGTTAAGSSSPRRTSPPRPGGPGPTSRRRVCRASSNCTRPTSPRRAGCSPVIYFVLFDIWAHVVSPALDALLPRLRTGALICTDNTAGERSRANYADLFAILETPAHGFRTMTVPFEGGFELSMKL